MSSFKRTLSPKEVDRILEKHAIWLANQREGIQWYERRVGGKQADFSDVDFTRIDKDRLMGLDLRFAIFSGSVMDGMSFDGTNLSGSDMSGATLTDVLMEKTILDGANMSNIQMFDFHIRLASMDGVILQGARLWSGRIVQSNLDNGNLSHAEAWKVSLQNCSLVNTDCRGIRLDGTGIYDTVLDGSNFEDALLPNAKIRKCSLKNVNLSHSDMTCTVLDRSLFYGTDLRYTEMKWANFLTATLTDVKLEGAKNVPIWLLNGTEPIPNIQQFPVDRLPLDWKWELDNDNGTINLRRPDNESVFDIPASKFSEEMKHEVEEHILNWDILYSTVDDENVEKTFWVDIKDSYDMRIKRMADFENWPDYCAYKGVPLEYKNSNLPKVTQTELNKVLEKHQLWLEGKPGGERAVLQGKNLRGLDMSGLNLRGIDLYWSDVSTVNFSGSDLREANMERVWAEYTNFTGANLSHARLNHIKAREIALVNANCTFTNMEYARIFESNLQGANFTGTKAVNSIFNYSDMSDTVLRGGDFSGGGFAEVKLVGANCFEATMKDGWFVRNLCAGANMQKTDFTNATFIGLNLRDTILLGAKMDGATIKDGINLDGAKNVPQWVMEQAGFPAPPSQPPTPAPAADLEDAFEMEM